MNEFAVVAGPARPRRAGGTGTRLRGASEKPFRGSVGTRPRRAGERCPRRAVERCPRPRRRRQRTATDRTRTGGGGENQGCGKQEPGTNHDNLPTARPRRRRIREQVTCHPAGMEVASAVPVTVLGRCDRCERKAELTRTFDRLLCALCLALSRRQRTGHRGEERRREPHDPRRFGRRLDDPQE